MRTLAASPCSVTIVVPSGSEPSARELAEINSANWRAKRSMTTTTEERRTDARHRKTR